MFQLRDLIADLRDRSETIQILQEGKKINISKVIQERTAE